MSAWYCIDTVGINSLFVTHGNERVKQIPYFMDILLQVETSSSPKLFPSICCNVDLYSGSENFTDSLNINTSFIAPRNFDTFEIFTVVGVVIL